MTAFARLVYKAYPPEDDTGCSGLGGAKAKRMCVVLTLFGQTKPALPTIAALGSSERVMLFNPTYRCQMIKSHSAIDIALHS